jgi:hypothetical protein
VVEVRKISWGMSCQMEFRIKTEGNRNKWIKRAPLTVRVKLSAVYTNLEKNNSADIYLIVGI